MDKKRLLEVLDNIIRWYDSPSKWVQGLFGLLKDGKPLSLSNFPVGTLRKNKQNVKCLCLETAIFAHTNNLIEREMISDEIKKTLSIPSIIVFNDNPSTTFEEIMRALNATRDRIRNSTY